MSWPKGKSHPFKGKSYEEIYGKERSILIRNKTSNSVKKNLPSGKCSNEEKEKARKIKISETMKSMKYGGYRKGSGRGKKGRYKGYWCDSSWELAFVIYNLDNNICFSRNNKKFAYKWKNKTYNFMPDFILFDKTYVEIKGYFTDQVKEKIKQFPEKLIIIDFEKIKDILQYVQNKYGKDFIKLYENTEECSSGL